MSTLLGAILVFLGWVGLVSATFMWGGYGIYQLVKTDIGFFSIILPCLGWWVLQMFISWIMLMVGAVLVSD
tara:strand:+ start:759 stop:971 length:213 start_codon:yes stop_codon:yes gene_type:complete